MSRRKKRHLGKKPTRAHGERCPRNPTNLSRLQEAERSLYRCTCAWDAE